VEAVTEPETVEATEEDAAEPGKRRRRRRGRKSVTNEVEASAGAEDAPEVEADSSPMAERPIDEEPAITETEPAEPAKPKGRRRKTQAPVTEVGVPEPELADAPPAEAAAPVKPARKSRSKKAAEPAETAAEPAAMPAANNDTAAEDELGDELGGPRRGWWQRTFG
jgi:ribonuclease E